jgi:hypothetical protein
MLRSGITGALALYIPALEGPARGRSDCIFGVNVVGTNPGGSWLSGKGTGGPLTTTMGAESLAATLGGRGSTSLDRCESGGLRICSKDCSCSEPCLGGLLVIEAVRVWICELSTSRTGELVLTGGSTMIPTDDLCPAGPLSCSESTGDGVLRLELCEFLRK